MNTNLEFGERRNPKTIAKCLKRCRKHDVCKNCIYEKLAEQSERLGSGEYCMDLLMDDARQAILYLLGRIDRLEGQLKEYQDNDS